MNEFKSYKRVAMSNPSVFTGQNADGVVTNKVRFEVIIDGRSIPVNHTVNQLRARMKRHIPWGVDGIDMFNFLKRMEHDAVVNVDYSHREIGELFVYDKGQIAQVESGETTPELATSNGEWANFVGFEAKETGTGAIVSDGKVYTFSKSESFDKYMESFPIYVAKAKSDMPLGGSESGAPDFGLKPPVDQSADSGAGSESGESDYNAKDAANNAGKGGKQVPSGPVTKQ